MYGFFVTIDIDKLCQDVPADGRDLGQIHSEEIAKALHRLADHVRARGTYGVQDALNSRGEVAVGVSTLMIHEVDPEDSEDVDPSA